MAGRSLFELAWLIEPSCAHRAEAVMTAAQLVRGSTVQAAKGLNMSATQLAREMLAPDEPEQVMATVQKLCEIAFAMGDMAWDPPRHRPAPSSSQGGERPEAEAMVSLRPGPAATASGEGLRAKEMAKKEFWVEELVAVARRAGPAAELPARLFQSYGEQFGQMLRLVLGRSAPGTLEGHVLRWKNIEA